MSTPYSTPETPGPDNERTFVPAQEAPALDAALSETGEAGSPPPDGDTLDAPVVPLVPIPHVYQMRTLQHLSRTLADEEARFRQASAWIERLQDSCHAVATEAMGLFSILEEERVTALRLAEEIALVSSQTLAAWPEQDIVRREATQIDELPVEQSSFHADRNAAISAQQQKTESFQEMWDTTPEIDSSRRSRRRRDKAVRS